MIVLAEVDSTNAELKRLAAKGAPLGTSVLALRQKSGYGQRGRSWASASGDGMYLSVLLPLQTPLTLLPLAVGLATRDAIGAYTDEVGIKWVNDLVARGHKLGGVLVEAVRGQAIAGIGLNLRSPAVANSIGLDALCTTLPTSEVLARAVLVALDARLAAWAADGSAGLLTDWRAACVVLGREVTIEGLTGIAEGVGARGELRVRDAEGKLHKVVSGTLRMADGAYC